MFALRLLPLALLCASAAASAAPVDRSLFVPLDHSRPAAGSARLDYELAAPFDPHKPTVIVVADGQQFYVRKGAMPALQQSLFGSGVNVVGLVTRGTTPAFVAASLGGDGKSDWQRAWRIFNADQWIADIDALRRALVGNGKVMLYGRSGGAYLVHQYLAVHGDHVSRAFTQSPVNPEIVRDLRIGLDRFWKTLGAGSPELQPMLADLLKRRPEERTRILITVQRQHFFVPAERLKEERAKLIRALASNDEAAYAQARKDYQVDDVMALLASNDSIPQTVRVLELIGPSGAFDAPEAGVSPLIEPQRSFAAPLIALEKAGRIPPPHFDLAALHRVPTEVFVLAAREDEAVDYRTTIALAYSYPNHQLFIADDNHTFARISGAGEDGK
ncbi:MAG TPA: alpha/beta fold hydrolase [Allosphingosinicella sp.]|jgi:pimeloyl-ACP methyl ester carboxylesterase|nr:alpha/beta fold hydrolase [Allosphingosinicella sp.]